MSSKVEVKEGRRHGASGHGLCFSNISTTGTHNCAPTCYVLFTFNSKYIHPDGIDVSHKSTSIQFLDIKDASKKT